MAIKYAKDQPAGFTNRIERVAIVGAGGHIGKHMVEALLKTGRHTVTAVTRAGSAAKLPTGIKKAVVDYSDEESLVTALKGQQFLIITMSVMAPPEQHDRLVDAAAKAGVPYVMPNCYGSDVTNVQLQHESMVGTTVLANIAHVEKLGVSSWIALVTGAWYDFCLIAGKEWFGFDHASKTWTFYDEGKNRISCSSLAQSGRAVAGLLSLKELPEDENDTAPALANWSNKPVYSSSFCIDQRGMFESWKRVSGETDADWKVVYQPVKERAAEGLERMKQGDMMGYTQAMFARFFYPTEDAVIEDRLDNKALGIEKEDPDAVTRLCKEKLDRGWTLADE